MSDRWYDDRYLAERGLRRLKAPGASPSCRFIEWQRRILRADYKMPVPDRFEVYAPAGKIDDLMAEARR